MGNEEVPIWNISFVPFVISHYTISHKVSNCYETEIEIWAGFGPVGNTEKKNGLLWATFEVGFFLFSGAKELHKMKLIFLNSWKFDNEF